MGKFYAEEAGTSSAAPGAVEPITMIDDSPPELKRG